MAKSVRRPGWSALVLAAGRSSRMGVRNKLLLRLDGRPVLATTLRAVAGSGVSEIIVVTGYQARLVGPLAQGVLLRAPQSGQIVHAEDFRRGLSASLKAGIDAVRPGTRGVIVCLGDMPGISSAVIDSLIAAYRPGDDAVVPVTNGRRGNPVLLARRLFPRLRTLRGDHGARPLLERTVGHIRHVPVADGGIHRDIDRPEDWRRLRDEDSRHSKEETRTPAPESPGRS